MSTALYLTPEEIAADAGVRVDSVYKWINHGRRRPHGLVRLDPGVQKTGRYKIPLENWRRFVEALNIPRMVTTGGAADERHHGS